MVKKPSALMKLFILIFNQNLNRHENIRGRLKPEFLLCSFFSVLLTVKSVSPKILIRL